LRRASQAEASRSAGTDTAWHLINCFEDGSRIIVEFWSSNRPSTRNINHPRPVRHCQPMCRRYVVDRKQQVRVERRALAYADTPDFPAIEQAVLPGSEYDGFWMLVFSGADCRDVSLRPTAQGSWSTWSGGMSSARNRALSGWRADLVEGSSSSALNTHENKAEGLIFEAGNVSKGRWRRLPAAPHDSSRLHASFDTCMTN